MLYLTLFSALLLYVNGQDDMSTTDMDTTDIATTADCDNSDVDEWRADYVGKSTQFRIYDPCSDRFLKIKMEGLTEFEGDTKTNNKETSFASAKGWTNGENSLTVVDYEGNRAIYNSYIADELKKSGAAFTLETRFFITEANITDVESGQWMIVQKNSLKFDVEISDWTMDQDTNYLQLCIGLMTNGNGNSEQDDDDENVYTLDGFEVDNVAVATCTDSNGDETNINVTVSQEGNGNNHLDLCYAFDSCVGDISYDPIIQIVGDDAVSVSHLYAVVIMAIMSLFV